MADMVIGDYTAAVTIDGTTNYLLIQPGNSSTAYKKINRDTFLGVTGQPADISTVQSLTNKTLDNTNTITVKDSLLTIQDNLDTTKQAQFQLSGITTATTRTYTLPDANTTLVGTGATQTLTNKTLTSPTITGGTIDNSTITVDAIAEHTAANGVTVDGLNIKDGKLNTNNSVVTNNITDAAVTPAKLVSGTGSTWVYQSWTITWTNLTVTGSTVTSKYTQIGKTVFYRITVVLGGGNVPSGTILFSLPVASVSYPGSNEVMPIGQADYLDAGVALWSGVVLWNSTTTGELRVNTAGGTYTSPTAVNATVPFTFGNGDEIHASGCYEAA